MATVMIRVPASFRDALKAEAKRTDQAMVDVLKSAYAAYIVKSFK